MKRNGLIKNRKVKKTLSRAKISYNHLNLEKDVWRHISVSKGQKFVQKMNTLSILASALPIAVNGCEINTERQESRDFPIDKFIGSKSVNMIENLVVLRPEMAEIWP